MECGHIVQALQQLTLNENHDKLYHELFSPNLGINNMV